jgi:hypothetical protein
VTSKPRFTRETASETSEMGLPSRFKALHRVRIGAGERNRTPDRLITNQLLYLLSYAS